MPQYVPLVGTLNDHGRYTSGVSRVSEDGHMDIHFEMTILASLIHPPTFEFRLLHDHVQQYVYGQYYILITSLNNPQRFWYFFYRSKKYVSMCGARCKFSVSRVYRKYEQERAAL